MIPHDNEADHHHRHPNGAGKTTFATEFLPNEAGCPVFINVDLIAAGLSPFRPELAAIKAGRLMLREMGGHVSHGESFAFATTLAGTRYARSIPRWQKAGYHVDWVEYDNSGSEPRIIDWKGKLPSVSITEARTVKPQQISEGAAYGQRL